MADQPEEPCKINADQLEPEQKRKVFIGSLSYRIDENTFREYWTKFGNVVDAMILRDREGRSRGFGFVTFDHSSAVDAVMKARPHTLDNRIVEPKRAVPREESHKPEMQLSVKKLYLGGVKEPITEDDLREYFGKYGTLNDVIIMKDRDGQYRGFGFVEFDDYDPVDRIILEKNHQIVGRPIDVQKAQMKDGSQRPNGNPMRSMRGRAGGGGIGGGGGGGSSYSHSHPPPPPPPPSMSRPNYNSGYDSYPSNNYNDPYPPMPNNPYNGYSSDFNGNGAPFGQGYGQESFSGPIRRGNMAGRGGSYAPYNSRGRGGGSNGPSWASWN